MGYAITYTRGVNCVYITSTGRCQKIKKRCKVLNVKGKRCSYKRLANRTTKHIREKDMVLRSTHDTLTSLLDNLFRGEENRLFRNGPEAEKSQEIRRKMGHYHFIPRMTQDVVRMLKTAWDFLYHERSKPIYRQHRGPKFVDCGCGVGNVVMLAYRMGFDAWGIEYDERTAEAGRELLSRFRMPPERIIQGDITKYVGYNKFDVVYGYCPMSNHKKEVAFEGFLKNQMKVGGILVGLSTVAGANGKRGEISYFQHAKSNNDPYGYDMGMSIKVG